MKTVLLIVAPQGYQPIEYGHTREVLEEAGIKVEVASNAKGIAVGSTNADEYECGKEVEKYLSVKVDFDLTEVDTSKYDGIFIIGGSGARLLLDNDATYAVMQRAAKQEKLLGAICISPRILAHAGLLTNKKATGWDGDGKLVGIFKEYNVIYVKEPVVRDGKIITADGPCSAYDFGKAIVEQLKQ